MTDHLSGHLQLNTAADKLMSLSMASTSYSAAVKSYSGFDTFQNIESYRTYDSIKIQLAKNNDILNGPPQKSGIKKVSKRPIYQQKSKSNPKKANIRQRGQLQKKVKIQQPKQLISTHQKDQFVQKLQNRCQQLDEQLKKIKLKQRRTTNNAARNNQMYQEYMAKAMLTVQNYAKQTFPLKNQVIQCQSNRPTQSCVTTITLQSQDFRNSIQQKPQKSNRFAAKLKRKLNEQIQKIKQVNQNTKEINAGCLIKNNSYSNSRDALRTPLTQRHKPKKSVARSGIEISSRDSMKNKRPQSSKQKLLQAQEMKFKIEKLQEQDKLELRGLKIEAKKHHRQLKTMHSNRHSEPQISKTFRHISPLYLRKNWSITKREVQQEKLKEKMLGILIDCHSQSIKKQTIQSGIKAFQTFTKKMTKRLVTTKKLFNSIQHTQTAAENQVEDHYY